MKWEDESCQASSGFIRQEIRDLIARGGVTVNELKTLRMNSYEREALVPALGDEALCYHVESCLAQCGRTRSPPSTYEEAVVGLLAPELVKRLQEKSLSEAADRGRRRIFADYIWRMRELWAMEEWHDDPKGLRQAAYLSAAKEAERVAADCWAGFDVEKDWR